jgi:hypothetical protein
MHALWNPSRFTGITDYQTCEDALLDDDDITENVRPGKLVPINIGGDGAFQVSWSGRHSRPGRHADRPRGAVSCAYNKFKY